MTHCLGVDGVNTVDIVCEDRAGVRDIALILVSPVPRKIQALLILYVGTYNKRQCHVRMTLHFCMHSN